MKELWDKIKEKASEVWEDAKEWVKSLFNGEHDGTPHND